MPADTGLRAVFARTFVHPVRAEPVPFNPGVLLGAAVLTLILIPLFGVVLSILTCGKIAWVPPLCSAGALLAVSVFLAWMAMLPGSCWARSCWLVGCPAGC